MFTTQTLLFVVLFAASSAESNDPRATVLDQVKVGQSATYSGGGGHYTITFYSQERKMELLAAHQKQLTKWEARMEERRLLKERGLQPPQIANHEFLKPSPPTFHRVSRVGSDFVTLKRDNRTVSIRLDFVAMLVFEEAEEQR